MDQPESTPMNFVQRKLPWIIGGVTLVFFLLTMSQSVTTSSLPVVGKVTGWDWSPSIQAPVFYLLTLPISFLSISSQPVALNVLTVILAVLSLFNLAKAVSLLPHDRTRDQRVREQSDFSLLSSPLAWIPPLFAVLVCGLQLSFWEHATSATGEMIDLLMFAYLIRCLLEYRIGENEKWMTRFAFLYGVSITNNWAMIAYFPLFLGAVIWIKGIAFFQGRFLLKSTFLGLLGLGLYLLLPVLLSSQYPDSGGIWDYLKLQLGNQKVVLTGFKRSVVLILSLTSIIPVVAIGVRWPSTFGDTSAAGAMLTNFMFKLIHMVFLAACIWVAFDPPFSPRVRGLGLPFLSFYFLGALAVGYYSGYALLIFSGAPSRRKSRQHRSSGSENFINVTCKGLVLLAAIGVPAGLLAKNWSSIQLTNGDVLSSYARTVIEPLPKEKSLLIVDDPFRSMMIKFALETSPDHEKSNYTVVDTSGLSTGFYQKIARENIKNDWEETLGAENIPPRISLGSVLNLVAAVIKQSPVYYMQSSFGIYFEYLFPRNHGLIMELQAYTQQDKSPYPPSLSEEDADKIQSYWASFDTEFKVLLDGIASDVPLCVAIGGMVAMERNNWGVKLQRMGRLDDAKAAFNAAKQYSNEISSADFNLEANELLSNQQPVVGIIDDQEWNKMQGKFRSTAQILKANGEIDVARFQNEMGIQLFTGGNFRQAALRFRRGIELDPSNTDFWLANSQALLNLGSPVELLETLKQLEQSGNDLDDSQKAEVTRLTALAHYRVGNKYYASKEDALGAKEFELAEGLLLKAREDFPKSEPIIETLAQVYLFTERYQEAAAMCDTHLNLNSDSVNARQTKAVSQMRAGDFESAVETLMEALEKNPNNNIALLNKAICHLQLEQLDEAAVDYKTLSERIENSHAVHYGLAEIAHQKNNTAEAIKHYESYLEIAPKGTSEFGKVKATLAALKVE